MLQVVIKFWLLKLTTACGVLFFSSFSYSEIIGEPSDLGLLLRVADEIRSSEPDRFNTLLNQLYKQQKKFSEEQQLYFNYLLTYQFTFQGKLTEAIKQSSLIINSNASDALKLRTHLIRVNIYALSQRWSEGLSSLLQILTVLPDLSNRRLYEQALGVITVFYNQLGQYELAEDYAKKLLKEGKNYRLKCFARNWIIESQVKLNKLKLKDDFIQNSIAECKQSAESAAVSYIYLNIGHAYQKNKPLQESIDYLIQHLDYVEASNYLRAVVEYYALMSKVYWQAKDIANAEYYAAQALAKATASQSKPVEALKVLYLIAKKQHKTELALERYIAYTEANQAYLDSVQAKHMAFQLAQHQTIQKENKIKLLNEQNQILRIQQQLTDVERENDRLFVLLAVIIILVLIFLGLRSWKTQQRLKQLAEFDALTGLLNRGHFAQVAKSTLKYCQQTQQRASLIMFDLDKFKSINDSYGHATGDWVLKKIAETCLELKREQDIIARIGGEEFCILLPSCGIYKTEQIAERYRQVLSRISSAETGFVFNISASFGITDTVSSGFSLERLLAGADAAMYQSKANGRDQVSLHITKNTEVNS